MAVIKSFEEIYRHTIELIKSQKPLRLAVISNESSNHKSIDDLEKNEILQPQFMNIDIETNDKIKSATINDAMPRAISMANDKQIDMIAVDEKYLVELFKYAQGDTTGFIEPERFLSHVAVFEHEDYHKLFMLSDAFVNPNPSLEDKVRIIKNVIEFANTLGVDLPKIAILAAVEKVYRGMPVTVEAETLKEMNSDKEIVDCLIDGPLSMDCAMNKKIAIDKGVDSEVAGDPDVLIAPDINTANAVYHAISKIGCAITGSLIIGGMAPVILLRSNIDNENSINSLMLGSYFSLTSKN